MWQCKCFSFHIQEKLIVQPKKEEPKKVIKDEEPDLDIARDNQRNNFALKISTPRFEI